MAYATLADIVARAGEEEILQIADRDNDGEVDADVIVAAIATAESEINGYISARYRLPLVQVPDLVKSWAVSIARYHLHRDGAPDHVVRDWKSAMDGLKDVARSLISLPITDGGEAPADDAGRVTLVQSPRPEQGFGGFL
ncbi:MAG: gp436 family protein [Allorhizobium sp.]